MNTSDDESISVTWSFAFVFISVFALSKEVPRGRTWEDDPLGDSFLGGSLGDFAGTLMITNV